jgi:phosphoglycolate phosphatase-like HAD superfamily hydrolase
MLEDLAAAGIGLAVVSSNDEANVRRILGPAAAPVGRFLCGAGLFGKAAAFRRIRRQSGLPASRILAVGDEVRDIEAGAPDGPARRRRLLGLRDARPPRGQPAAAHLPQHRRDRPGADTGATALLTRASEAGY